jgi:hypothetical protein
MFCFSGRRISISKTSSKREMIHKQKKTFPLLPISGFDSVGFELRLIVVVVNDGEFFLLKYLIFSFSFFIKPRHNIFHSKDKIKFLFRN